MLPVSGIPARGPDLRFFLYVGLGLLAGITYVVFDIHSEAEIRNGTLTGTAAGAHALIDHTFPILLGGLLGVVARFVRLRRELADARDVAARAQALRTRLMKVERDQAVWVLAAKVLHELNNPLHAIGLLLEEVQGKGEGQADEPRRGELLSRMRVQADRARSHLHALRSMRGLGEPESQSIALEQIASAVVDDVGLLAAEDGLEVRLNCARPVQAIADPSYVRTILENLVDNGMHSLRLGGGPGRITIDVGAEEGRAIVLVSDDGPALAPDVRAVLFEPLRTTKTHGLGLGLPLARALARSMRGDLSLDDMYRKAFRLELPLHKTP